MRIEICVFIKIKFRVKCIYGMGKEGSSDESGGMIKNFITK